MKRCIKKSEKGEKKIDMRKAFTAIPVQLYVRCFVHLEELLL